MTWPPWQIAFSDVTMTLGLLLAAALLAGGLGQLLRLPKVTSYLLAGVLLGPSLLNWIPADHVRQIEPLTKLAIALVLFNLGCHFPLVRVRRIFRRTMRFSMGELGATFLLVTAGLWLLGLIGGGLDWTGALLLGALALATAPATTILMLKETESEGPVTEYAQALVAVNNFVSIVLFELLFLLVLFVHGKLGESLLLQVGRLAHDLVGSVALGVIAGLLVSLCFPLVAQSRRLVLLVGVITLVLGACLTADVPYLLAFLAMGLTVANSSYETRQVLSELDRLTGLLCVVFFVTHGSELEIDKLWLAGWIGAGYVALRSCGKYFGIRLAGRLKHEEPVVRRWLGAALVAQAGAAIALSAIAVDRAAELGDGPLIALCEHVQTIILGTVVVFEIAGPLLIRQAVLRAGEVPLAHAIYHPGTTLGDQLRAVFNRLLLAFGLDPWRGRSTAEMAVNDIMRKTVKGMLHSATFAKVIEYIEHSRDNTFPVVDQSGDLVGVIRYRELSHALFDLSLGALVRAADVTTPASLVLYPDEPIARANQLFTTSKDDCIPVIAAEEPHRLLGVVRRRDVFRLLTREGGSSH
ncbi:MAG TPA: cation:proton antiporter [Thermoguttaceae bacterium]|nr:cation:proton antiporter [Thermoguttaceae bacterium]